MTAHRLHTIVHLDVDPRSASVAHREMMYEVWVPGGDVARIVFKDQKWQWTQCWETWPSEKPVQAEVGDEFHRMEFRIHSADFRTNQVKRNDDVPVFDRFGEENKTMHVGRPPSERTNYESVILSTKTEGEQVAFGVYGYAQYPRSETVPEKVWQWVSAAVVPWKRMCDSKSTFGMEMFMWSDSRLSTEVNHTNEFLVVSLASAAVIGGVKTPVEDDIRNVMSNYVIPEFMALYATTFPADMLRDPTLGKSAYATRLSTFNTPLEGLPYQITDVKFGDEATKEDTLGSSAQSWYYFTKSVVDADWLLARLGEVSWLHGYDLDNYERDVDNIIKSAGKVWTELEEQKYQRLLTDVIRIVTMHASSSPYVSDTRYDDKGKAYPSDTFTTALTVPGDCEDGAQSAYMIYMSILFTKWEDAKLKSLKKLAAFLGMPVCITGTATNPDKLWNETKTRGGTHAFGCVIPFPRFVDALYGEDPDTQRAAYARFFDIFGYEYPDNVGHFDRSSVETTVITGSLLSHHHVHPQSRELYTVVMDLAEREFMEYSCASRNISFSRVLDMQHMCHLSAVKAYTVAHRMLFYEGEIKTRLQCVPKLLGGKEDATEYSCTFAFERPDGTIAVRADELYLPEHDNGWTLRVPHAMTESVWKSDVRLVSNARRPYVSLRKRDADPQKPLVHGLHDINSMVKLAMPKGGFPYERPHAIVFVYDAGLIYPEDAEHVMEKLTKMKDELGAQGVTANTYDKSLAIVFYDIP